MLFYKAMSTSCDGASFWGPCTWQFMHYIAKNGATSTRMTTADLREFYVDVLPKVLPVSHVAAYKSFVDGTPFPLVQSDVPVWVFNAHNYVRQVLKQPKVFTDVAQVDVAMQWDACTNRTSTIQTPAPWMYSQLYAAGLSCIALTVSLLVPVP